MEGADELRRATVKKQETATECSKVAEETQDSSASLQAAVDSTMKDRPDCNHNSLDLENLMESLIENQVKFEVPGTGYVYQGETFDGKIHGRGRLTLSPNQFLEGTWAMDRLIALSFGRMTCDAAQQTVCIVKQQEDYLLSSHGDDFLAIVNPIGLKELDITAAIDGLKTSFFEKLVVSEIWRDTFRSEEGVFINDFPTKLGVVLDKEYGLIPGLDALMVLCKHSKEKNLPSILLDENSPSALRHAASNIRKSKALQSLNLQGYFNEACSDRIAKHRQALAHDCPADLPRLVAEIQSLPASRILYITKEDVGMFKHLVSLPCFELRKQFFDFMIDRYIQAVNNVPEYTPPSKVFPVMLPVYFQLVQSFLEVTSEIVEATDCTFANLIGDSSGLHGLKWSVCYNVDSQSELYTAERALKTKLAINHRKALEAQYAFIFELMEHFSPDKYVENRIFEYEFRMLDKSLLSEGDETDAEDYEKCGARPDDDAEDVEESDTNADDAKNVGGAETNADDAQDDERCGKSAVNEYDAESKQKLMELPDERLVWLYILDHTIFEVFKNDLRRVEHLKPYQNLLREHVSFVGKSSVDSLEVLRVLSVSVMNYVIYTAPYAIGASEKSNGFFVFTRHMRSALAAYQEMQTGPLTSKYACDLHVTDLVAEFSRYWKLQSLINVEKASGYFSPHVTEVVQKIIPTVVYSLSKSTNTTTCARFFKSINNFLNGLTRIDLENCFFVNSELLCPEIMENVNYNYYSNYTKRIKNISAFVQVLQTKGQPVPNHHVIKIASKWIEYVDICLRRRWASKAKPLHSTRLECAGVLLDGLERFFSHLGDYSTFMDFEVGDDAFLKKPFENLLNLTSNPIFFSKSVDKIVENLRQSIWCMEKKESIDELLLESDDSWDAQMLSECYDRFWRHYRRYILIYCSDHLSEGKSGFPGGAQDKHFSRWNLFHLTQDIPRLLAGLSSVWSCTASHEPFPMPHTFQIVTVFRLLFRSFVDPDLDLSEVKNHFAHIMAGQGKSLVLALLGATFALTGHNVKIVCHNEYLSSRDDNVFSEFFQTIWVHEKIVYVTFQAVTDILRHPYDGKSTKSFSSLLVDQVKNHIDHSSALDLAPNTENTVLLIDELDLLLSPQFYGQLDTTLTSTKLVGLSDVQEKIWRFAKTEKWDALQIVRLSKKYIDDKIKAGHRHLRELNTFWNKPGTFSILDTDENNELCVKEYTNQSFFDDSLLKMAKSALKCAHGFVPWVKTDISMEDTGIWSCRYPECDCSDGICGYHNTFNCLRSANFFSYADRSRYGFLLLNSGKISYARAPALFPLVLGVTAIPTDVFECEKTAVDVYNVKLFSSVPSGESNGDPDFLFVRDEKHWLRYILNKVKQIFEANRAILIFFESEKDMFLFEREYMTRRGVRMSSQLEEFGQLNSLTEKTEVKLRDKFIGEAGLPRTVTLATRRMGRGVNYKPSPDVKNEGGLHVMQTFFSADIKEEIHIRGRTACHGEKGTYELVVCKKHLIRENIIPVYDDCCHSYTTLNSIRSELMDEQEKRLSANLRKSDKEHNTTMEYFFPSKL